MTYPEAGLVYGDTSIIGPTGEEHSPRCDRQHGGKDFKGCELIELLGWNFICAPTIIARRELLLRHLPIPPHLAFSDWYFTVNMARETEFYYVDSVIADYRVHSGNFHGRTILDKSEERSVLLVPRSGLRIPKNGARNYRIASCARGGRSMDAIILRSRTNTSAL